MRGENGEFVAQYLYPREVIECPPTVRLGHLSVEEEASNRALGCLLIAKAGQMLTLPQSTICSAQILLHRTYFRVSQHVYRLLRVCMTSVFLASKVEETPVRLRDVLAVFDRLLKRRAGLDPSPLAESRFQGWSAAVSSMEGVMLRELGFELYIDMPHGFILHFINYIHPRLAETPEAEQRVWDELNQRSWNALNDALFSPRVLFSYAPQVVACAGIFVAASLLGLALPEDWWRLFDVATAQLDACALDLATLYGRMAQYAEAPLSRDEDQLTLEYTPTDPNDNATNNELCVYRSKNRQALLQEKRRKEMEAKESAAVAAAASAAASTASSSSLSTLPLTPISESAASDSTASSSTVADSSAPMQM